LYLRFKQSFSSEEYHLGKLNVPLYRDLGTLIENT
jgi:hypothetical protein